MVGRFVMEITKVQHRPDNMPVMAVEDNHLDDAGRPSGTAQSKKDR
jgi:hypothetical protein